MKLSDQELAVLASVELKAQDPIEKIRKETGLREHTIRYALRRLADKKIIHPVPFINLHRLGYTIYTVMFSVAVDNRKGSKNTLLKSLLTSPYVLWIGEFGGEYQYGIGFCCKTFAELISYMRELSEKHEQIFFDKAISVQISSTIFPRRYLWKKKLNISPITSTFSADGVYEADDLDRRILSGLTSHSLLSHRQLAMKLEVPLSTVELRIKKLRENKVILADMFAIDSEALGKESFKLLVYTKGLNLNFTEALHKFCLQRNEVVHLIDLLGVWGYEIGVEVNSGQQVTHIIQDLYEAFPGLINTIRPLTKFRYPKFRFFPQVD
jgi:DNA-binding Lrp family transcriptional regulator